MQTFFNQSKLAVRLGLSLPTVREKIRSREIKPSARIKGGGPLFSEQDVAAYLAGGKRRKNPISTKPRTRP